MNNANLKPPKKKPITEELERLLAEEAPNSDGKTWAAVIAEALLHKARKGDVRAITELANRIEGKAVQAVEVNADMSDAIIERLTAGRKRILNRMTQEQFPERAKQLDNNADG